MCGDLFSTHLFITLRVYFEFFDILIIEANFINEAVVFEESIDFKIGDVTLETYFGVTIPDYGIKIPECNTTGPIINPVYVPLRSIINFIELRGLHPQLEKSEDAEKIYYWIKAWNETANEINKKENLMLNPIISNTE